MRRLLTIIIGLLLSLRLFGCKADTVILDWVIYRIDTPDGIYVVNKYDVAYGFTSLVTDKITISFDRNTFEFVDYYNNKYTGTYKRKKDYVVQLKFDNGEVVNASCRDNGGEQKLTFIFDNVEYEFYETNSTYYEYTTEEYEKDLRKAGSIIRDVYETENFICDHNPNRCIENICKGEIIDNGDRFIIKCLRGEYEDISILKAEIDYVYSYIYIIDSTNLIKEIKDINDIKPGICVYRHVCDEVVYIFEE